MSALRVGDRVRVRQPNDAKGAPKLYGIVDAKQAGVYRIALDNGEQILTHRDQLAFQGRGRSAQAQTTEVICQ